MSEKHRAPPAPAEVRRREVIISVGGVLVAAVLIGVAHYAGDPLWVRQHLRPTAGSDVAIWQVQTTFLSVGFAGLAIAAQLFAEAPLAIGASRGRVLAYIGAGWFVGVGLAANIVMALEAIWLPSATGVVVAFAWFVATAVLLLVSTSRLTRLFGQPSRLDEVVRSSLVETLSDRLDLMAHRYAGATKGLDELLSPDSIVRTSPESVSTLEVPVPDAGRVVKGIRAKVVRQAIASLGIPARHRRSDVRSNAEEYVPPRIVLDVYPGERTRLGDTAFRVITASPVEAATAGRIVRLLQSSIELEPPGAVTPYEETEHEIATLKDAIGTNLRSGALATAERALDVLGHVVRGVWVAQSDHIELSRKESSIRGSGLSRSLREVEQDVVLSPQVAHVLIDAATVRALEAPATGSSEYVDECLRSFTRQWSDILRQGGPEFDGMPRRIVTRIRDLAVKSPAADEPDLLRSHGVWAMVELVKLALDAERPEDATVAADELRRLFAVDEEGSARTEVRAGLLVLSAWLRYLADTKDHRYPADPGLETTLLPDGSWRDIFAARDVIDRGTPFSRWDSWETESRVTGSTEVSRLPGFLDRAQLSALLGASGALPDAADDETASEYERLLRLIPDATHATGAEEGHLKQRLEEEIGEWDAGEPERLARQPLSSARIEALAVGLRRVLDERERLLDALSDRPEAQGAADESEQILGMNFRVARHYFVDAGVSHSVDDIESLARMIASAFTEAEDRQLVTALAAAEGTRLDPSASSLPAVVEILRAEAEHFVLLTAHDGLGEAVRGYPAAFTEELDRVRLIETGAIEEGAILFDRRTTLRCHRGPEQRDGLSPVEGTSLALGVHDDVRDLDGSQVRVELGERFSVWPGEAPRVFRLERGR
ncbi:hypothetical protein [Cryocola sp. 340MFSha3.1]|uniref:hypothetical protein n=1 Tax=Cryocola sp. 340MFSha3.1 TaxID=1169145 RepID=UPI000362571D|nr:hypothetical protein [Cryocola sp. 340MFSha3.1]